jgi:hypothetical protein
MIVVQLQVNVWFIVQPPEAFGRESTHIDSRINLLFALRVFPIHNSLVVRYATIKYRDSTRVPAAPAKGFVGSVQDDGGSFPVIEQTLFAREQFSLNRRRERHKPSGCGFILVDRGPSLPQFVSA